MSEFFRLPKPILKHTEPTFIAAAEMVTKRITAAYEAGKPLRIKGQLGIDIRFACTHTHKFNFADRPAFAEWYYTYGDVKWVRSAVAIMEYPVPLYATEDAVLTKVLQHPYEVKMLKRAGANLYMGNPPKYRQMSAGRREQLKRAQRERYWRTKQKREQGDR